MATTLPEALEQLKKQADALRPLKPEEEERLWKKFRLEWNYNSNHIEGNTLTYSETELLLIFGKTTGDHDKREYDEMQAHDVAVKMVQELAGDHERPLTESFIRKLNEIILVIPYWKEAITPNGERSRREIKIGEYKSLPNSVRLQNGEMFNYASPEETPALMHDLMKWYNENGNLHPLELAALFHYKFVRIHPFDDGNGRVARLVMNYILMKTGYPPVVIKSDDKNNYLTALNKVDAGNLDAFIIYAGKQLLWSLDISIKAAKGLSIDESEDLDKKLHLLNRKIENKIDIVEKSNYHVARVIREVYLPLIQYSIDRIQKMAYLFEGIEITYFKEPEELNGRIPLGATISSTLESISTYFINIAGQKGESYHRFKTGVWLINYKKSTNKFSAEASFRIYFDRYDYHIESNISAPYASGFILRQFVDLMKKIDSSVPTDDFDVTDISVGKWKYLEKAEGEFLKSKADEIANRMFDFIEGRIGKLKK